MPVLAGWLWVLLVGCGNCGDFAYHGYEAREECGTTYGTQGTWYNSTTAEDGDGVVVLEFLHSASPGVFDFTSTARVTATFLADELRFRNQIGLDRAKVWCSWSDRRDPLDASDDLYFSELATEASIRFNRPAFTSDVGDVAVRRFDWRIVCGDAVIELDARDNVGLVKLDSDAPFEEITTYLGEGGQDSGDTGL